MGILRTALYCCLSKDDMAQGDSENIKTLENICQGRFHHEDEIPPLGNQCAFFNRRVE